LVALVGGGLLGRRIDGVVRDKLLLEMAKDNQANPDPEFKLKVDIAMWNRVAKDTGREYKYLSTEVYKPKPKQVEPQSDFGGMDDGLDEDIPF